MNKKYAQNLVEFKDFLLPFIPRVFLRYVLLFTIFFVELFILRKLVKLIYFKENGEDNFYASKKLPLLSTISEGNKIPLPAMERWQNVSEGFVVFSAFYDHRMPSKPSIRIIAAANKPTMPTWCRLWYNASNPHKLEKSHFIHIKAMKKKGDGLSGKNDYYTTVLVKCPLTQHDVPVYVSLLTTQEIHPYNLVAVRNLPAHPARAHPAHDGWPMNSTDSVSEVSTLRFKDAMVKAPDSIVLCLKLPYLSNDKVMNLLEFLELYSLLGVQHYFIYTHPLQEEDTTCIMSTYSTQRIVTVIPWIAANMNKEDSLFEAKDAADNDCVHRARFTYSYALLVDVNGFIIPRKYWSLQQLIADLLRRVNAENSSLVSGFMFSIATFYMNLKDDVNASKIEKLQNGFLTLTKTRRSKYLKHHKEYILVPERVTNVNRRLYRNFSENQRLRVSAEDAILHVYRDCNVGNHRHRCEQTKTHVTDKTAHRYGDKLASAVLNRYHSVTCPLSKIFKNFFVHTSARRNVKRHKRDIVLL